MCYNRHRKDKEMYLNLSRTICTTMDKTEKYAHRSYINFIKSKVEHYDELNEVDKYKAFNYLMTYNMDIKDMNTVWVEVSKIPSHLIHIISYVDTYCK